MSKLTTPEDQQVQMDRRYKDRRSQTEEGAGAVTSEEQPQRRKKQRRRQIDPTTCERDYNLEEIDFMQALDAYKRSSGRMFPTCSEILEVIRDLGYVKLSDEDRQLLESVSEVEAEMAEGVNDEVAEAEFFDDDDEDELSDDFE